MQPKQKNSSKLIMVVLVYLVLLFFVLHYSAIMAEMPGNDYMAALKLLSEHITKQPFNIKFDLNAIGMYSMVFAGVCLYYYAEAQANKHDMEGKEAGSAHWNTDYRNYNKKYTSPFGKTTCDGPDNMILSQRLRLSMNGNKTRLNNNILIIGGSGSGKSRFEVKPNICQMNASFVVTDPKAELLEATGDMLKKNGYKVLVFNTMEMQFSDTYNSFAYLHEDEDLLVMVNTFILNKQPKGASSGDPFWTDSEKALVTAICAYLYHRCPLEDQNWANVEKMLALAEVDESKPDAISRLDIMFSKLDEAVKAECEEKGVPYEPDLATQQYGIFKHASGKTAKSILISARVHMQHFQVQKVAHLTNTDSLDLSKIGEEKTALFCVVSASDSTFNYLVSLLYTQLFNELYLNAYKEHNGKLPIPVRFLLDEFANIGTIPDFAQKLSTMRSYNISCTIILQGLGQIKAMYKDDYDTLISNCDTKIFLGGNDETTTKYISGILGKATITSQSKGRSFGKGGSSSKNFSQTARDLLAPDEVGLIDNGYEIVMIRSMSPFFDKKYDYPKHPNYKYTGDADSKLIYPFRTIYTERNEIEKIEKQAKQKAEIVRRLNRKKANVAAKYGIDMSAAMRKPSMISAGGVKLLSQMDAGEELTKYPDEQQKLLESYLPPEFDADFEFRDGQTVTDDDFNAMLIKTHKLMDEESVELLSVDGDD